MSPTKIFFSKKFLIDRFTAAIWFGGCWLGQQMMALSYDRLKTAASTSISLDGLTRHSLATNMFAAAGRSSDQCHNARKLLERAIRSPEWRVAHS